VAFITLAPVIFNVIALIVVSKCVVRLVAGRAY